MITGVVGSVRRSSRQIRSPINARLAALNRRCSDIALRCTTQRGMALDLEAMQPEDGVSSVYERCLREEQRYVGEAEA